MIEIRRENDGWHWYYLSRACRSGMVLGGSFGWSSPDRALAQAWLSFGGHIPALVFV